MFMILAKLCIFIFITALIYFLVPKKFQYIVLLVANLIFYIWFGTMFIIPLLVVTFVSFFAGLWLEKEKVLFSIQKEQAEDQAGKSIIKKIYTQKKKRILSLTIILILGIWVFFKYTGWISILGISYYSFITIGYCIDVYRGKYEAEHNLLKYATFLTLFFQIIQGPFSRYDVMRETLYEPHTFSYPRLQEGCLRILYGMFKKCMIADKLSPVVDYIYQNYQNMNGIYIFLVIIFWVFELYADFSGYMDIMAGAANIMGIRMQENFRQPFFSKSVEEFWRRWHITLGAWFRDYLFYPVSIGKSVQTIGKKAKKILGNRMGRQLPSYIALFMVWSATGLLHGFRMHFWIWGLMQMIVIIFSIQMEPMYEKVRKGMRIKADNKFYFLFRIVRTFLLFGFIEVMSQAVDVGQACSMYAQLFTQWDFSVLTSFGTIFPQIIEIDRYLIVFIMVS